MFTRIKHQILKLYGVLCWRLENCYSSKLLLKGWMPTMLEFHGLMNFVKCVSISRWREFTIRVCMSFNSKGMTSSMGFKSWLGHVSMHPCCWSSIQIVVGSNKCSWSRLVSFIWDFLRMQVHFLLRYLSFNETC